MLRKVRSTNGPGFIVYDVPDNVTKATDVARYGRWTAAKDAHGWFHGGHVAASPDRAAVYEALPLTTDRPDATPFGPERAEAIWAARVTQNEIKPEPGEDSHIRNVWESMPGHTTYMDAFHRIRRGEV